MEEHPVALGSLPLLAAETYHGHVVLLTVCGVGAGDALGGNGSTLLGGHGVHGGPETK